MAKIFIVLALGFVVGFRGILKEKGLKINAKLQTVWLMLLIFCMGVSIGRNGDIIQALPSLGGKALLYAVLAVIGSIVVVYLLIKVFLRKGANE